MQQVTIRRMKKEDIPDKVRWINNDENNRFLHYDLPLEVLKTEKWFENNRGNDTRYDGIIQYNDVPVGVIGILDIKEGQGEFYITLGETEYKRKGISVKATCEMLKYAFDNLGLDMVYLYTETENIPAQKLFEKAGFIKKGIEKGKALNRGKKVDRFYYEHRGEGIV